MMDKEYLSEIIAIETKKTNKTQQRSLKENYNCYMSLSYAETCSGDLVIDTTTSGLKKLEYYMGFEYIDSEFLLCKLQTNDFVRVVYSVDNERIENFFNLLEQNEEEIEETQLV